MTTFVLDPNTDTVASARAVRRFQRHQYCDKQFHGGEQEWRDRLENSSTLYVGNLSCYTNEYQLYELFSRCGSIKRIIMGLDRIKKQPCGFCFVEFDERASALKAIRYIRGTYLDGRNITLDMDAGFQEGRQYGRGKSGGQIGDERAREREAGGGYANRRGGGANPGSAALLTRSITIVACLTMISLLFVAQSSQGAEVSTDIRIMPFGGLLGGAYSPIFNPYVNRYDGRTGRYINLNRVRQAQVTRQRKEFEIDLATFLVNLMKSAKPTLLKAFIKATLADKQLKETAIGLFFGSGEEESEDSEDKETEKEDKKKDEKDEEKEEKEKDKDKDKKKDKRKRGSKDKDKE